MSMSKGQIVGWSILGGVIGATLVLGVAGGLAHHHMKGGLYLPMTLEMQTNAGTPSTLHVYATIRRCHHKRSGKRMVTLTIEPFKVMASGVFTAASALPLLPVPCVPVADAAAVKAVMYGSDNKSIIDGSLTVGANGTMVLTASAPSVDGGAWGLARPVSIDYEVADM